jgi:hypothetical protein
MQKRRAGADRVLVDIVEYLTRYKTEIFYTIDRLGTFMIHQFWVKCEI